MSTFRDRKETVLVVVDAQTGVLSSCHDRDAVVDRINDLVTSAREAGALWSGCSIAATNFQRAATCGK